MAKKNKKKLKSLFIRLRKSLLIFRTTFGLIITWIANRTTSNIYICIDRSSTRLSSKKYILWWWSLDFEPFKFAILTEVINTLNVYFNENRKLKNDLICLK